MRKKKTINIEIGINIKNNREKAGFSQEKLSEVLNITPNHLSAIERGVSGMSLELMRNICNALSVPSDSILFENKELGERANAILRKLEGVNPEYNDIFVKIVNLYIEIIDAKEPRGK